MKLVLSRKYFQRRRWKITTSIYPVYYDFRFTGGAKIQPSKEIGAFNLVKIYERKNALGDYAIVRIVRDDWKERKAI